MQKNAFNCFNFHESVLSNCLFQWISSEHWFTCIIHTSKQGQKSWKWLTSYDWSREKNIENHWSAKEKDSELKSELISITASTYKNYSSVSSNPDLNKGARRGWNWIRLLKWSRIRGWLGPTGTHFHTKMSIQITTDNSNIN